ncbi:MAG TPA: ZIP family metal transporter [Rhodocyclaceae bacterium]|nr:ZIP family metal transporter [Rhodocyclaceae bacterium]
MVAKVARLHFQSANASGLLRVLGGWGVALSGLALLAHQFGNALPEVSDGVRDALLGGLMAATATALGALPVLAMRRIGAHLQGLLLGFGAGVMLAASLFSLLLPGFDAARLQGADGLAAGLTVTAGLVVGAALLLALDRALPHTHSPGTSRTVGAAWLFVFAIAAHNVPEGLAIGVAAGAAASGDAVATGISLQNVPEGLIVALALATAGYRRLFSFAVAAASGLVEPLAAVLGAAMMTASAALLPWGLAGAAGAMLFVVSHEIIPESHRRGHETLATGGLIGGFVIMMLLDTVLG